VNATLTKSSFSAKRLVAFSLLKRGALSSRLGSGAKKSPSTGSRNCLRFDGLEEVKQAKEVLRIRSAVNKSEMSGNS